MNSELLATVSVSLAKDLGYVVSFSVSRLSVIQ